MSTYPPPASKQSVLQTIRRELRLDRLASSLMLGTITGVLEVFFILSFAALIFTGITTPHLSSGIGMALLGTAAATLFVALFSTLPGAISGSQDTPAAITAIIAISIMATLPETISSQDAFIVVSLTVALITLLTGLFFILVGSFSLGNLVRYLPYPVVGGFLAGTGWLLFSGALGVATGLTTPNAQWLALIQPEMLLRWLPAFLMALLLVVLTERVKHILILPVVLLASLVLFYLVTFSAGISLQQLSDGGWLLGPFPTGNLWTIPAWSQIGIYEWEHILSQLPNIATVIILSLVGILLNASGLELMAGRDIELNKELHTTGIANLLSGLSGGLVCYHFLSLSSLSIKSGNGSRLVGVVSSGVVLIVLALSATALALFPRMVIGELIMYLGIVFLKEWIIDAWRSLPRLEYGIVIMILFVIAIFGFLPGVGVGLVAAVMLFVVAYSRTDVVHQTFTGTELSSRMVRASAESRYLHQAGRRLQIFCLQGFLFFGTAHQLLIQIRGRLQAAMDEPIEIVVLDFRRVTGLDSTAVLSLRKLAQLMNARSGKLVITEILPTYQKKLIQEGLDNEIGVFYFADLDRGMEWSENEILRQDEFVEETAVDLRTLLTPILPFMTRQEIASGAVLIRQGEPPDCLYFLESGQVTAQTERSGKTPVRLETMRAGRVVGELGFYLQQKRTAVVVADVPSVVYRLTRDDLALMEAEDPAAVAALHQLIVNLLAERVTHLVGAVNALQQ